MQLIDTQLEVIENLAWDFDIEPRAYSGRGMFGRSCLGLPVNDLRQAVQFLVALGQEDADLAGDLAGNLTTDSLGYGTIVYFPRFEWKGEDEDEEY